MSTEGWIFMVGFRVFDVGLLIAWLVWFFHLREDPGDEPPDDGGGGGGDSRDRGPRRGPGSGGLRLPTGPWTRGRWRRRDGHPPTLRRPGRLGRPVPQPLPSRVRSPATPRRAPSRSKTEHGKPTGEP
ncbi:MAG TPA: hypothetical protein VHF90_08595 [Thermoleophilaceae bacterium]|nr:hypothetical protein [Thermoleophilaceae bacterium]